MADIRIEFGELPQETSRDVVTSDEEASSSYLASRSRQPNDPNSAAQREVTSMNREMDQWSQAAAPNVFAEEKSQ